MANNFLTSSAWAKIDLILLCAYHHRLEHNLVKPKGKDKRIIRKNKKDNKPKRKKIEPWRLKQKRMSGLVTIIRP